MRKFLLAVVLVLVSLPVLAKDIIDNERLKVVISGKYKIGALFVKPKVIVLSYDSPVLKEALEEIVKKNGFEVGEMPPYGSKISSGDLASETALTLRFEYKGFAEDYKPQDMPTKLNIGSLVMDLGFNYLFKKSINPMAFAGNNVQSIMNTVNLMDMSVSNNTEMGAEDFSGEVKNSHRMAIYRVSKHHVQGWENVLVIAKNPEVTEQEIDDAALVGIAVAFSLKNE